MTVTLFHAPLSCSIASRFALTEAGIDHELKIIRVMAGEQHTESYKAINPRSKVPALVVDEGLITESTAILPYIADMVPDKNLFPKAGSYERAVAQSWLGYFSSTVHVSFTGCFRPDRLSMDANAAEGIKTAHLDLITHSLTPLEEHLTKQDFILDNFSVCDLYLTVFLLWRGSPAIGGRLPLFPAFDAFQQRIVSRPALAKVMADEMRLFSEPMHNL